MAQRQSSLLSFFKGGNTPKISTPVRSAASTSVRANDSPLTSQCNKERSVSPIKPSVKRRRVVVSSDEEDDGENVKQQVKLEPPMTPKAPARQKAAPTPSRTPKATPKVCTEMAESFINSFRFDESMNVSMSESTMNTTASEAKLPMKLVEQERYTHETLDFLQPDKIRDACKRPKSDPDYDPSTLFVPASFIQEQTPGHKQWWAIKSANFDTILLFKVGKFYELYHMDAVVSVNSLGLAYMRGSYAHTGFPEAAYGKFADQLVARGLKVARVEQTETPQQLEERNKGAKGAKDKVVRRELCRITTTATKTYGVLDGENCGMSDLDSGARYLLAIKEQCVAGKSTYGVCFIDTSIGQFNICQFEDDDYRSYLRTLVAKYAPAQVVLERGRVSRPTSSILNSMMASVPQETLSPKKQFLLADDTVTLLAKSKYLGANVCTWSPNLRSMLDDSSVVPKPSHDFSLAWSSLGAILSYLERCLIDVDMVTMNNFVTFPSLLISKEKENVAADEQFWKGRCLVLDGVTISNLNLLPSADAQASNVSLYNVMNNCGTAFGRRRLRQWICAPTCDPDVIASRQSAVSFLSSPESAAFTKPLIGLLKELPDLERLLQKIHTCGLKYRAESHPDSRAVMFEATTYNKRKIKNLAIAIDGFASCVKVFTLFAQKTENCPSALIAELMDMECANALTSVLELFQSSIDMKKALESGRIEPKPGHDADYDTACQRVKDCLADLESYRKEQEHTLKCCITYIGNGKNRYQMEMTDSKTLSSKYDLKGRRKGYARYQTPELLALIDDLSEAEQNQEKQASESARKVFEEFDEKRPMWCSVVERLSTLDVLFSLARYAQTSTMEMCLPEFVFSSDKPMIVIENGSHPCLAAQTAPGSSASFIANDTHLGGAQPNTMLLTGPNMGGKSTLMRQVAVLTVMAHMGSLVPARSMKLSPVDRIFTRIGANDKIMCGESTFFVEMKETQLIMRDASIHSLVLVDELGRGTSTFDGTAIASAVMEEFANKLRCRTFFSTHYHSLCATANPNIIQAHMACMVENENEDDPTEESVTFLYKLTEGACPKSYGFYAAKLAGVRDEVVRHAFVSSARIAKSVALSCSARMRLREAAAGGYSVEELERMVAAL